LELTLNVKLYGIAFVLGSLTLAIMIWLGLTGPAQSCGGSEIAPVVAFQAVRTPADLMAIFGADPTECRMALVDRLRMSTERDLFLFIPIYASFLAVLGFAMNGSRLLLLFLLAAVLVTVAGDAVETLSQLWVLESIDGGAYHLAALSWGNGFKTLGLSLVLAGLASTIWPVQGWLNKSLAIALCGLALVRAASLIADDLRPAAPLMALVAFFLLWVYVGARLVTRRI
jgi:hypothetical protein